MSQHILENGRCIEQVLTRCHSHVLAQLSAGQRSQYPLVTTTELTNVQYCMSVATRTSQLSRDGRIVVGQLFQLLDTGCGSLSLLYLRRNHGHERAFKPGCLFILGIIF
jgi:hypothetical protein